MHSGYSHSATFPYFFPPVPPPCKSIYSPPQDWIGWAAYCMLRLYSFVLSTCKVIMDLQTQHRLLHPLASCLHGFFFFFKRKYTWGLSVSSGCLSILVQFSWITLCHFICGFPTFSRAELLPCLGVSCLWSAFYSGITCGIFFSLDTSVILLTAIGFCWHVCLIFPLNLAWLPCVVCAVWPPPGPADSCSEPPLAAPVLCWLSA